jgi:CRISPR-associated Csx2 family protein
METGQNHLICSVGVGNYRELTYRLDDKEVTTRFAPVALAKVLGLAGAAADVLVTKEAEDKWYLSLAQELRKAGLEPKPVRVPLGESPAELEEIFDALVTIVGDGDSVVLDISLSLRHLPVVYLAALTYLMAHRRVTIQGVYSGAAEAPRLEGAPAPILELTPLVNLTRWYHALQSAQGIGDFRLLAQMVTKEVGSGFRSGTGDHALGNVRNALNKLAPPLAAGLPLEVGLAAQRLAEALDEHMHAAKGSLALRRSLEPLVPLVERWVETSGANRKTLVPLNKTELQRQLHLVEWYVERDNIPAALLILREWLVSYSLWRRGEASAWLDPKNRFSIEHFLNALSQRSRVIDATDVDTQLMKTWDSIKDERNRFAHAGMRTKDVTPDEGVRVKLRATLESCRALLDSEQGLTPTSAGGRLLVTPLGLSPGVIYTGIRAVTPNALVVITSRQARRRLGEALAQAGGVDLPVMVKELDDPHAGFIEAGKVVDDDLRRELLQATDVVVNITGGTTALQHAAECVARAAEGLVVPLRRVALIDRRPPEEQRADPYVAGEVVPLDQEEGTKHGEFAEA